MPNSTENITKQILKILKHYKGTAIRTTDLKLELSAFGHKFTDKALNYTLKRLTGQGVVFKVGRGLYGIPNVWNDGRRTLTIKQKHTQKILEWRINANEEVKV